MSLRQILSQIADLQALNSDIQREKKDRDSLRLDVERQQALLKELTRRVDEGKERKIAGQKAADALELKVREHEDTVARLDVQLNVTKHQDEYDKIRQSIASHKADIAKWEDEELELLQQTDDLKREEATLAAQLAEAGEGLQRVERTVAERAAQHDQRISELQQQRDALEAHIDPRVLNAYRRVAGSRDESALAEVKSRICQGCHTTITKQTENLLLHDAEIVYCHSCGRILMLAEGETALTGDR